MSLSIRKIGSHPIWHIESDGRYELAMTFLRMQEWYESGNPEFRHHTFTLDAYMDWYVREYGKGKASFTYADDWGGFNIPSTAVNAVLREFLPHTLHEKVLFQLLSDAGASSEPTYYLIGSRVGQTAFFEHELCHARFGVIPAYRHDVLQVLERFPVIRFRKWLGQLGYAEAVFDDEVHAYMLTGYEKYPHAVTKEMRALTDALRNVASRYI